ncbi:MAG: DUF5318 family protein [Ilumatobacteraceae bacterium]|jgi:hypothetical protein|nr:DUF5318 family protein [Ilumatobacteraceae bacterium]MBJ7421497.1 DUF5318 family protein [Ilumatobacteraceae bacterium]
MPRKQAQKKQSNDSDDFDLNVGEIDHRLTRRAVINNFRRGVISQDSICDAHPELMRVARNFGRTTRVKCPICVNDHLVTVTYLFGPRLPSHGKFIATRAEIEHFGQRPEQYTGYLIEVCRSCSWHHLLKTRSV